ncbi:site-specific integrase, partial [Ferrimicrobium sp.]|uniref:site-specific integrase n=1 Tax=Ferrimicrobium sp. TaxID=2926050 RepID=UPI002620A83E
MTNAELHLEQRAGSWAIAGAGVSGFALVNDYLSYLSDRNYSPQTVRAYGFSLLAFCRWLLIENIALDTVSTDVLLQYLAVCRQTTVPGRPGPNVVRLDGRRADGYATATLNHRLAVISGLF